MDVSWYLRFLRAHQMALAAATIVGVVIGLASWQVGRDGDGSPSHYRATSTLIFQRPPDRADWAYQSIDELALLATGRDVTEGVASGRSLTADDVAARIITRTDEAARSLELTVVGRGARQVTALADAVGDSLKTTVAATEQVRLSAERDRLAGRLQTFADELARLDDQIAGSTGSDLDVLSAQRRGLFNQYAFAYEQFQQLGGPDAATERLATFRDAVPIQISRGDYEALVDQIAQGEGHLRADREGTRETLPVASTGWADSAVARALLGGFVGLLIGLGVALVIDRMRPRLRTRAEAAEAFGVPVLAAVPRLEKGDGPDVVVTAAHPQSRAAEAYRAARSRMATSAWVDLSRTSGGASVILVGSASPGEGKTTAAANLATVFAETGASVLAINCDLHRCRLGALLGATASYDVSSVTVVDGVRYADPAVGGDVSSPSAAAAEQRAFVAQARGEFDVIVLDTAPLLTTNDATELLPVVDVVVLVARSGVSTLQGAADVSELLAHYGTPVAGVVFLDPYLDARDPYYDSSRAPWARTQRRHADGEAPSARRDQGVVRVNP